jgi:predicted DNA-binding protein (UPF0251 family)
MRFRRVAGMPHCRHFRPAGRGASCEEVVLTVEEFEAIRLNDHEGLDQKDAAKKMDISQPTFQRIYNSARKKIADSIVNGKPLRIEGGMFVLPGERPRMMQRRMIRRIHG